MNIQNLEYSATCYNGFHQVLDKKKEQSHHVYPVIQYSLSHVTADPNRGDVNACLPSEQHLLLLGVVLGNHKGSGEIKRVCNQIISTNKYGVLTT
jgi:hypothetical protein